MPRWSLKQCLVLILTGGAALFFLVIALLLWMGQDEDLLDDSDLRIAPAEGRDYRSDDNGHRRLLALNPIREAEENLPDLQDIMEAENGEPDWEALRQRLAEKQEALDQLEYILAAPYFTLEWPLHPGAEFFGISEALWLARWEGAKARLLLQDGEPDQAWEEVEQVMRLGQRLVEGDSTLVDMLVGISIKAIALGVIHENVSAFSPTAVVTRQRTDRLQAFWITQESLRRVMRFEYMFALSALETVDGGNYTTITGEKPLTIWLLYKPKQSRNLFLQHYREFIDNLGRPAKEMAFPRLEEVEEGMSWSELLSGNATGHYLVELTLPSINAALISALSVNSQLQLARLGLALAGYAHEHNSDLPEKLEVLAPTYIDAIPLDPLTGEVFFYQVEERKVWSVGKDLKDDGGLPVGDRSHQEPHDFVIEIPKLSIE